MAVCAFFGHRDTPCNYRIENMMEDLVRGLIAKGVDEFWVCYEGNFDWISRMVISRIKKEVDLFMNLHVCYVSAYNPNRYSKARQNWIWENYELIYTDEIANGPQKFAIERRNKYITGHADYIICYIKNEKGGAYKAVKRARKNGAVIFNVADMIDQRFV